MNVTLNLNNNNIELWDNQEYKDRNMPYPMILENRLEVYNYFNIDTVIALLSRTFSVERIPNNRISVENKSIILENFKENTLEIVWIACRESDEIANNVALKIENQQSSVKQLGSIEVNMTKTKILNKEICDLLFN